MKLPKTKSHGGKALGMQRFVLQTFPIAPLPANAAAAFVVESFPCVAVLKDCASKHSTCSCRLPNLTLSCWKALAKALVGSPSSWPAFGGTEKNMMLVCKDEDSCTCLCLKPIMPKSKWEQYIRWRRAPELGSCVNITI